MLEKKDVRAALSPEAHAVALAKADLNGMDVGPYCSQRLEELFLKELEDAKLLVDRAERAGKGRNPPDSPGSTRTHTARKS